MTIHTIEESRALITKNFNLIKGILSNTTLNAIKEDDTLTENIIQNMNNSNLTSKTIISDMMKKILGNNTVFSAYMKDNNLSFDTLFDKVSNNNQLTVKCLS